MWKEVHGKMSEICRSFEQIGVWRNARRKKRSSETESGREEKRTGNESSLVEHFNVFSQLFPACYARVTVDLVCREGLNN